MGAQPTVLLFDVDGTLVLTGGAGRRGFERAFAHVTGRRNACDGLSFGGMTDRGIARAGLIALEREPDEATIEQLLEHYLDALADELAHTTKYTIMPGVDAIVRALSSHAHIAIGLGTGNVRRGAEAKLRHGKLWELFAFGGFGCDHERRSELLRIGARRGAEHLRCALSDCRVVVIGDTTRDVIAAQEISADCVAVETGGIEGDVLRSAGRCSVHRDLTAPGLLERLIG